MDIKETAVKGFDYARGVLEKDLEALPDETFVKSMGGVSRTVADIVHELVVVNKHVCEAIRGSNAPWPHEGFITAPADFQSKAASIANFKSASAEVSAFIESLSEAQLEEVVQTEHGERSAFQRCQFMTLHMWYHSGQLNYIQTLLGDSGWHW